MKTCNNYHAPIAWSEADSNQCPVCEQRHKVAQLEGPRQVLTELERAQLQGENTLLQNRLSEATAGRDIALRDACEWREKFCRAEKLAKDRAAMLSAVRTALTP